jgi:hypothetical protein
MGRADVDVMGKNPGIFFLMFLFNYPVDSHRILSNRNRNLFDTFYEQPTPSGSLGHLVGASLGRAVDANQKEIYLDL